MFLFGCESKDIEKNGSETIDLTDEYNGNTSSDNSSVSESISSADNDSDISSANPSDEAQKDNNAKDDNSGSHQNTTSSKSGGSSSQNSNDGNNNSNQSGSSSSSSGNNSTASQNQQDEQNSQQQTASGWQFSDIDVNLAVQGYLEYVNSKRAEIGVAPFVVGSKISQLAKIRSVEIQSNFSHNRYGGKSATCIFSEYKYGKFNTVSMVPGWETMKWKYFIDENGDYYEPELCSEVIGLSSFDYRWPYADKTELSKKAGIDVGMGMCGSPGHWAYVKDPRFTACGVGISLVDNKDGTCSVYVSQLLTDKLYE